jgi:hypothetical protein
VKLSVVDETASFANDVEREDNPELPVKNQSYCN